jgi:hypothetical protein
MNFLDINPTSIWIAINAVGVLSTLVGPSPNKALSLSLALGFSTLSCALLLTRMTGLFLLLEVATWGLHIFVGAITLAVRPPAEPRADVSGLVLAATLRFIGAVVIWLCV